MRNFNFPGTYRRPLDMPGPARNYSAAMYGQRPLGRRVVGFVSRHALAGMSGGAKAGYRHRGKIWPFLTGLGMLALAASARLIPDGWKTILVLAVLAGVILGWKQWRALRDEQAWVRASLAVSWSTWAVCSAWTAAAAAVGPVTLPMPGLLLAGTVVAQGWWVWHQMIRDTHQVVEQDIEERATTWVETVAEQWRTRIAREGGRLPGTVLESVRAVIRSDEQTGGEARLGWEAKVKLPIDDQQTWESVVSATRVIAKVFGVPASQVVPEMPVDGTEDSARLLVLTSNPLREIQVHERCQLDPTTGYIPIGVHADGSYALWRLFTPGSGANHGLIAGTTGSGKSGLLNKICAEIRHSGLALLLLGDPQGGESCPDWTDGGAHVFAGTVPRIRRMLQGVEREMDRRQRTRGRERWVDGKGRNRRGRGYFNPTRDEPLLMVVIDEAPEVTADPECRRIIAKIAKQGRKIGVGIILLVQVPSLSELGNDLSIRSMLSSTNIVILRTSDSYSAQMGAPMKLPVDPVNLPVEWPDGSTTAGLGFLIKVGGRVSPMRVQYVDDAYEWASTGDPASMPEETLASGVDEQGNFFVDWLDLLDVDDADEDQDYKDSIGPGGIHQIRIPAGTRDKVAEFLRERGEPVRLGVIADAVGVSRSAAHNQLRRMQRAGVVFQPTGRGSHGKWGLLVQDTPQDEMAASGVA